MSVAAALHDCVDEEAAKWLHGRMQQHGSSMVQTGRAPHQPMQGPHSPGASPAGTAALEAGRLGQRRHSTVANVSVCHQCVCH